MDRRVVDFAQLLRENGLRVSLAEELDAVTALAVLGVDDRESTKTALRAAVVKRAADVPTFDELFDLYFSGLGEAIRLGAEAGRKALQLGEEEYRELLTRLAELAAGMDGELSPLTRELLRDDPGRLQQRLRRALEEAGVGAIRQFFQEGRYTHALAQQLGLGRVSEDLDRLRDRLREAGLEPELERKLAELIERRRRDLAELIKRAVRIELEKRSAASRRRDDLERLAEKSFYYLSEDEIRRMREAVTRLAQRLRNVVSIRRRRARRGRLDVQDTLRRNLQYGGVPFRIQLDRRVRDRPQVVVLCDVSDSVRNVSRFMLQFVYSLQDLYSRVRSFIFVAEVGETTRLFDENDIQTALDLSLTGNVINVFAHSDFGRAFRQFHDQYLGAVNRRTTVIILGDARNNYNAPHEWVLREIRERARQLIWLNPESRLTWGFGDSEMDRYQPHCDVVEECRNLRQLYRVIDRLVA